MSCGAAARCLDVAQMRNAEGYAIAKLLMGEFLEALKNEKRGINFRKMEIIPTAE